MRLFDTRRSPSRVGAGGQAKRKRCTGLFLLLLAGASGCTGGGSQFRIVDYRQDGGTRSLSESFEEAYYDLDAEGNVDIVLRHVAPSEVHAGQPITQMILLRSFWRSLPGKTSSDRTQINGTVTYALMIGGSGTCFEGGGSLFFYADDLDSDKITGSLDYALLKPTRRVNDPEPLFGNAELSGTFTARRNPRIVVRTVNELERVFGERGSSTKP